MLQTLTPVAGSIFRPLSQTHIPKSEFKNGLISRFCSIFQVIQVISSAKFFSAEEVGLSFNSVTKEHYQISNPSFWKRDRENVFSTNVLIRGEMNPLHKHKIMSVEYQVKQNLKSRSWNHFWKCESEKVVQKLILLPALCHASQRALRTWSWCLRLTWFLDVPVSLFGSNTGGENTWGVNPQIFLSWIKRSQPQVWLIRVTVYTCRSHRMNLKSILSRHASQSWRYGPTRWFSQSRTPLD